MTDLTFVDAEHGARPAHGRVDGDRVLLDAGALGELTGWQLKPEGLCRADVCVPVRDPDLTVDGAIDVGIAPDFTLPQLVGGTFTFSTLGRRKKLWLAWSSW